MLWLILAADIPFKATLFVNFLILKHIMRLSMVGYQRHVLGSGWNNSGIANKLIGR